MNSNRNRRVNYSREVGTRPGYGLWIDWRTNWAMNRALEKIMMRFEGKSTIFDIADELGLNYWETRAYVEKFRSHGLVTAEPVPFVGELH